jgi:hypothetical protein
MTPQFGGDEEESQPRDHHRRVFQFRRVRLWLAIKQQKPTIEIVGEHGQLKVDLIGVKARRRNRLRHSLELTHYGVHSYVDSAIMSSLWAARRGERHVDWVVFRTALHNHKVERKAKSSSSALNRRGLEPAGANLPRTFSSIERFASTYPVSGLDILMAEPQGNNSGI